MTDSLCGSVSMHVLLGALVLAPAAPLGRGDVMLWGLFGGAEDYPELRASEHFRLLQERISSLEERIADRRAFYNESATIFNARVRQFPDLLFARAMELAPRELFQADEEDLLQVDVGTRLTDLDHAATVGIRRLALARS